MRRVKCSIVWGRIPRLGLARPRPTASACIWEAVEILYGEGGKAQRDTLYADAMRALAEMHPEDHEATAFYSLALLGLSQGDRNVPTYLQAAEVAKPVFEQNNDHPGAAHYIIHSYDDPSNASKGLEAARAYSVIAPDAGHAQHMTSHIFLAMGMWDDVIRANINATAVVERNQESVARGVWALQRVAALRVSAGRSGRGGRASDARVPR